MVNLHIYVARTIFLLFKYDFMITKTLNLSNWEYKSAYLNQYSLIYIYQELYGKMISIFTKWEQNIGVILHIYVVVAIFLLFYDDFMMKKTPKMRNWKYKTAYLN